MRKTFILDMFNSGINKCSHPICLSNWKDFDRRCRGLPLCYNINTSFVKIASLFLSKVSKYIEHSYGPSLPRWKWSFTFLSVMLIL